MPGRLDVGLRYNEAPGKGGPYTHPLFGSQIRIWRSRKEKIDERDAWQNLIKEIMGNTSCSLYSCIEVGT